MHPHEEVELFFDVGKFRAPGSCRFLGSVEIEGFKGLVGLGEVNDLFVVYVREPIVCLEVRKNTSMSRWSRFQSVLLFLVRICLRRSLIHGDRPRGKSPICRK